ncbi:MAG: zinc ribbon domain-containing protein [Acidobacteriia bacterium]|nr:zinc ribbon domain-containing protein [Terriglobia bacterium]
MPLYEYRCTSCGERTEVLQRLGAAPPSQCARCGGALEKLSSVPALQFKGTGWYVTDYANRSASADSKDSPPSVITKTETKSESTSAAKPADKPAAKPATSETAPKTT